MKTEEDMYMYVYVHGGGVFILVRSAITSTEIVEIEPKAE